MKRRVFLQSTLAFASTTSTALARPPFALYSEPVPLLSPPFQDERGQMLHLSDFSGRVVLLNVWATWCPPCHKEMPALDALQGQLGDKDFAIVPVSIDSEGIGVARRFYDDIGIRNLGLYWGVDLRVKFAFEVFGLPTSLLIDRKGRELGRVIGPARWDGAAARSQIERLIAAA